MALSDVDYLDVIVRTAHISTRSLLPEPTNPSKNPGSGSGGGGGDIVYLRSSHISAHSNLKML